MFPEPRALVVDKQRPGIVEPRHAIGVADIFVRLRGNDDHRIHLQKVSQFLHKHRLFAAGIFLTDLVYQDRSLFSVNHIAAIDYQIGSLVVRQFQKIGRVFGAMAGKAFEVGGTIPELNESIRRQLNRHKITAPDVRSTGDNSQTIAENGSKRLSNLRMLYRQAIRDIDMFVSSSGTIVVSHAEAIAV